jgi:hypothetical protein
MSGDSRLDRRGFLAAAGAASALIATPAASRTSGVSAGPFRGFADRGAAAFLGIRYARAARFAAPVREPWPTARIDALAFGPVAPQAGTGQAGQSEDCLFLNVWTPEADARARRPVMVYFHGGAYASGTATDPLTQGPHLALHGDVVVVTVNHRLNAFGYAWLKPFGLRFADSGNLGQLDLLACARLGARPHRRFRRRSCAGHGVRPIGRRREDCHVDGHAGGERPVPRRSDDERPASHRQRPGQRLGANAGVNGQARPRRQRSRALARDAVGAAGRGPRG